MKKRQESDLQFMGHMSVSVVGAVSKLGDTRGRRIDGKNKFSFGHVEFEALGSSRWSCLVRREETEVGLEVRGEF